MLSVRLKPDLEKRLSRLAEETQRSKSHYVERALEEFLQDQEDYMIALARYEKIQRGERTYSLEELREYLKLEEDHS